MSGVQETIEVKFRLSDGTDIGPSSFDPSTTVAALNEFVLAQWPQDQQIVPKNVSDVKLINAGTVLVNNRTLAESRVSVAVVTGGVITMHVVVRPPQSEKRDSAADVDAQYCDLNGQPHCIWCCLQVRVNNISFQAIFERLENGTKSWKLAVIFKI